MKAPGRQTTYGALLAVIAITILVAGYYLKPKQVADKKDPAAEITIIQAEVDRLRELAQRNSLRATSARLAAVANEAASHLVFAQPSRRPGVIWDRNGSILLPAEAAPPPPWIQVRSDGKEIAARHTVWGAGIPFALVRAEMAPGPAPASVGSPEALLPGSWLLAVSVDSHGRPRFSSANYTGLSPVSCGTTALPRLETSLPLAESSIGSGIFDLDGNLVGVVARCGNEIAALSAAAVPAALAPARDASTGPSLRAGIRVAEISAKWAPFANGAAGLFVTDVWKGWPADRAGIRPGDIVNSIGGEPVAATADLGKALETGPEVKLRLRRGRRSLTVTVAGGDGARAEAAPLEVRGPAAGVEIAGVLSGGEAELAGLMPGDRIVTLNRVPATRAAVARLFASSAAGKPALAEIERGTRRFLTVVTQ